MAEFKVARVDELAPGQMKQVQAGMTAVLLVRLEDGFHALGALCSHYEAPLAAGALCRDRVICPWHHATFDVRTGKLLEPPGLDGLPVYPVRVDDGEVWVTIPEQQEAQSPPDRRPGDNRICAIVGGGCAGAYAVESLRDHGFGGRILWITGGEEFPPVDRPVLSKGYLSGEASEAWIPLRQPDYYPIRDIEILERKAVALDAGQKAITLDDGNVIEYDTAILATGAVARALPIPGVDLHGVHLLRTLGDAKDLRQAAEKGKTAVIIGAGFIGMEVAQSLNKRGLKVSVVAPEAVPFERVLGAEIGAMMRDLHQAAGVEFYLGHTVQCLEGDQRVSQVRLDNDRTLEADIVVIGVGVKPATDFVSCVTKDPDGSIVVDQTLKAADGLYAAGDLASFPDWRTGERIRVEHWRVAAQHGRLAGANAAGDQQVYRGVPYFWTRQYGVTLHYFGHAREWDEIRIDGDLRQKQFIAHFVKNGKVYAVAGMERERELAKLEEEMYRSGFIQL